MKIVRKSRSMGALSRRFERDRVFQFGETVVGPASTPAGNDNSGLSLRFGTYAERAKPVYWRLGPLRGVMGDQAQAWAELSDMECGWLILHPKLVICLRR